MAKKKIESKDKKLTVKQENFCNYYIETASASEAYRKAYACAKMKDKTINERASRLLKEYKISTRVKELQNKLQLESDITKEEAVKFLTDVVRANYLDYVEVEGFVTIKANTDKEEVSISETIQITKTKDLSKLTLDQQRCIKSIVPTRFGVRVELHDAKSALERLSKMLGWDEATKLSIEENINQVTVFELPSNGRDKNK